MVFRSSFSAQGALNRGNVLSSSECALETAKIIINSPSSTTQGAATEYRAPGLLRVIKQTCGSEHKLCAPTDGTWLPLQHPHFFSSFVLRDEDECIQIPSSLCNADKNKLYGEFFEDIKGKHY